MERKAGYVTWLITWLILWLIDCLFVWCMKTWITYIISIVWFVHNRHPTNTCFICRWSDLQPWVLSERGALQILLRQQCVLVLNSYEKKRIVGQIHLGHSFFWLIWVVMIVWLCVLSKRARLCKFLRQRCFLHLTEQEKAKLKKFMAQPRTPLAQPFYKNHYKNVQEAVQPVAENRRFFVRLLLYSDIMVLNSLRAAKWCPGILKFKWQLQTVCNMFCR